jgi:hypothetical protein
VIVTIAYYAVLLAVLVYLAMYGGKAGLWAGALQCVTALMTLGVVALFHGTPAVLPMMALVDFISFGWKVALVMMCNRRWPIWVAAFQLNVVAAHIAVWIVPKWLDGLYYAMMTVWAIPSLLAMIVGTALDHRYDQRNSNA